MFVWCVGGVLCGCILWVGGVSWGWSLICVVCGWCVSCVGCVSYGVWVVCFVSGLCVLWVVCFVWCMIGVLVGGG